MAHSQNYLAHRLPRAERDALVSQCTKIDLVLGTVLCEAGDSLRHVYFPIDSFISLIANTDDHPGLEVGMIGREGMLGAHTALGVRRVPLQAVVQGAGSTLRIDVDVFTDLVANSPTLKKSMLRYIYVLMAQLSSSIGCLRHHHIGERLARWLLMSQDRAHSSEFQVTQEFLAYMLGVRRVGITEAAGTLQKAGLIEYTRGEMKVLDRQGLENAACSCYAADILSYSRQMK